MNHEALRDFFDYQHPTPGFIRKKYEGRIVDLRGYPSLTDENVLYEVLTLKSSQALILPDRYSTKLLGVPDHPLDELDSNYRHFIHWRYAEDMRLNTTEMGVEDATDQHFSLRSAMKTASWDYTENRRGFGIVDVRTHEYTLYPFLYLVEGFKMEDLSCELIDISSSEGFDVVGSVPSLTRLDSHLVTVKNMPYVDGEEHVLATQLHGKCNCEWSHFGTRRADQRRYVGGERMMCRHSIALYRKIQHASERELLDTFPGLTGIMNPWYTIGKKTIVDGSKLTKTRMNCLLGKIIAYMSVQKAFKLD